MNRMQSLSEPTAGETRRLISRRAHWFDQPELHLALFGFLLSFVWEMWQMPFYRMGDIEVMEATRTCTLATVGDAFLMVFGYSVVSLAARDRGWMSAPHAWMLAVYLAVGLTVTVLFEAVATRASWGWTYSEKMPFVPFTDIAIIPLVMWSVIPLAALALARRQPLDR